MKIVGQQYSYDSTTGLNWLNPSATAGLSYPAVTSSSTLMLQGWRYATGEELNALLRSNLPSLTTALAADVSGNPFYGGATSDFYAPPQFDTAGETTNLIATLGGRTITYGGGDGVYGILGQFDRIATCSGIGCLFSHAVAGIAVGPNGQNAQAFLAGGAADCCPDGRVGSFLVRSSLTPVPLPPVTLLFISGIIGLIAITATRTHHKRLI